jgi:hypothetical protein
MAMCNSGHLSLGRFNTDEFDDVVREANKLSRRWGVQGEEIIAFAALCIQLGKRTHLVVDPERQLSVTNSERPSTTDDTCLRNPQRRVPDPLGRPIS